MQRRYIVFLSLFIGGLTMIGIPHRALAFTARVVRIVDGETIVLDDGRYLGLYGVDAPSISSQHCLSKKSKRALERFVKGKKIRVKLASKDFDTVGRLTVYVYRKKKNINRVMLVKGFAKSTITTVTSSKDQKLLNSQTQAQQKNRGVWSQCTSADDAALSMNGDVKIQLQWANVVLDRGDKTTTALQTESHAMCVITLPYDVNSTTAIMGPLNADADGNVQFQWYVPSTLDPGDWPYIVTCTLGKRTGTYRNIIQVFLPH